MDNKDFNFTLPIKGYVERAVGTGEDVYGLPPGNYMFIEGWASDASQDKLHGKMSERCIVGMVNCVNHGTLTPLFNSVEDARRAELPLAADGSGSKGNVGGPAVGIDVDHSQHWTDQIGYAVEAKAIYDLSPEMKRAYPDATPPVMWVKSAVDLEMSHGRDLRRALQKGTQLGKSIFGRVEEGERKVSKSGEVLQENFDLITLKKIAITSAPVNNVTWVKEVARSMNGVAMNEKIEESGTIPHSTDVTTTRTTAETNKNAEDAKGTPAEEVIVVVSSTQTSNDASSPGTVEATETSETSETETSEAAKTDETTTAQDPDSSGLDEEVSDQSPFITVQTVDSKDTVEAPGGEGLPNTEQPEVLPAQPAPAQSAPAQSAPAQPAPPLPVPVSTPSLTPPPTPTPNDFTSDSDVGTQVEVGRGGPSSVYVGADIFRSFQESVIAALESLPAQVARAESLITEKEEGLITRIEAQALLIEKQADVMKSLVGRIDQWGKQPRGRAGVVVRSFLEEEAEHNKPLRDTISEDKRIEIQRSLVKSGNTAGAMALMMGWAKDEDGLEPGAPNPLSDMTPVYQPQ